MYQRAAAPKSRCFSNLRCYLRNQEEHNLSILVQSFLTLILLTIRLLATCPLVQEFLTTRGSPQSHIERCEFSKEFSGHQELDYSGFEVRH